MELSRKIMSIRPSATLAVTAKAKDLKAAGKDVIAFAAGEPVSYTHLDVYKRQIIRYNTYFSQIF